MISEASVSHSVHGAWALASQHASQVTRQYRENIDTGNLDVHFSGGPASRRGVCIQEGSLHPGGGEICIQGGWEDSP